MVTRDTVNDWIIQFTTAWRNHDIDCILNLFGSTKEYYEGPFSSPVSTREEIALLWEEIVYQSITALDVDVIALEDGICAMHWYLNYQDIRDNNVYMMDGTYEVHFNNEEKCVYFKQWWVMAY